MKHFRQQAARGKLPAWLEVQRLEAINTSTLDLPALLTPTALRELRQSQRTGHRTAHYQLTPGSVGCYMSHVRAWKALLARGADVGLVFEDDAQLRGDFWAKVTQRAPADWDVLLLGGDCSCCSRDKVRGTRYHQVGRFWGMQAYVISANAARKLLAGGRLFPIAQQVDSLLSELAADGQLKVYIKEPQVATQAWELLGTSQNPVEGKDVWARAPSASSAQE
jgi:GR25 family glycosyltransferase involved in LPS biosynthesis